MNVLLDTHVALWWADDSESLNSDLAGVLADPLNEIWVSAASAWELAIKVAAGKLDVDVGRLFTGLQGRGLRLLGIGVDDGIEAAGLRWAHRDPFDRMLVAQAHRAELLLATRDRAILAFVRDAALEA